MHIIHLIRDLYPPCTKSYDPTIKRHITQFKNWQRIKTDIFPKQIYLAIYIGTEVEAWDQPACLELGGTDKIGGFRGPDVGHEQE